MSEQNGLVFSRLLCRGVIGGMNRGGGKEISKIQVRAGRQVGGGARGGPRTLGVALLAAVGILERK